MGTAFQLAMMILSAIMAARNQHGGQRSEAIVSAAAKLTLLYQDFVQAARQSAELTPEQDAALDQQAELVFSSPASDPEANK